MPDEIANAQIDGLLNAAKWINFLILAGVTLAASVIVLRLLGHQTFKFGEFELKLRAFPIVIVALTIGHAWVTWMFIGKINSIKASDARFSRLAWAKLTNSDAFIFHSMEPRVFDPSGGAFSAGSYVAATSDIAFWVVLLFAVAAMVSTVTALAPSLNRNSVLRLEFRTVRQIFNYAALGCSLAAANWIIGSQWAIKASSLVR